MADDIRKQTNQRPYLPGANTTTSTHSWDAMLATARKNANAPVLSETLSDAQFDNLTKAAETDEKAAERLAKNESEARDFVSGELNTALFDILDNDSLYLPNTLSSLYNPTYHFRLYMTTEQELVETAKTQKEMLTTLDAMPKVIIAESGVTAGFNITDVEIEQATGPGFRTRSAMMSGLTMTIVEPLGSSLVEQIITAGADLGVQNFAKFWYFLELTFMGYDDQNGAINTNPLAGDQYDNGGRWVYQIAFTDMKMHVDETGATYNLTALPYSSAAFEDDGCGRVPDVMKIYGKTINEFCTQMANQLTRAWSQRYAGEIYTFKIIVKPVKDANGADIDIGNFTLNQTDKDSIRGVKFLDQDAPDPNSLGGGENVPLAQIPRGTAIADVLTFLYAHCEGAQKLMLDTTSPEKLEDGEGDDESVNWNGKKYRVAMIPYIEPDVKVTGYDPITGNYMKEITYVIWGYRNYTANMCSSQYKMVRDNPNVSVDIVKDLLDKKYLQKRYHYLYTGRNTEVIKFDIDFNFAFSALLPSLSGWRQNVDAISVHEKFNPVTRDAGGSYTTQKNETAMSPEKLQEKLSKIDGDVEEAQGELDAEEDPNKQRDIQARIDNLRVQQSSLVGAASAIREKAKLFSKVNQDRLAREGVQNLYAEDAQPVTVPFQVSYRQGSDEAAQAAGMGFFDQWHRGSSLTGALLNQIYSPIPDTLASITLDIKGDPYWLGMAHLERRAVVQNPATAPRPDNRPSYTDGDSTFGILFRFPKTVSADGKQVFRQDDMFNGVYRAVNVKHNFKDGQFTQTLSAIKLELVSLARPNTGAATNSK